MSDKSRGAVVVTGASTGIGEATATHLASLGFKVFAGVRKDADAERLKAGGSERLEPVRLDVTDAGSIEDAVAAVSEKADGGELAGLVNNAGIAVSGPIEFIPVEELRRQLDVNVVGQIAVTKAFLPMLRKGRGRVVNIGSIGGRVALPLLGPYAASKFAMEALTDSLRREVSSLGVEVSIIEPGAISTPIWEKSSAAAVDLMSDWPPQAQALYGDLIAVVQAEAERIPERGLPPKAVAEVVEHALTARRPKTRYLVGRDAKARAVIARILPDRVFDRLIARALSRSRSAPPAVPAGRARSESLS
jgi:NAD(P)-dependent dehydrogenase (short-subunit alcohol dehydrogenase family)